jgi:hypothetical protein
MTKRTPRGASDGGEFAANEHDEAGSPLLRSPEDDEYYGTIRTLNRAARNGDPDAVNERRDLIERFRDERGFDSINFETNHVARSVTQEQALAELTSDLAEAQRCEALDPEYEYSAEIVGSEVKLHMKPVMGRKPRRTHFANHSWMRLEARANSYCKNGVQVTLTADKPWLVV